MLFKDEISLIVVENTTNDNGFTEKVETSNRTVFANKKSVRQSEFYQAANINVELTQMFEIRTEDYEGEKIIKYDNNYYYIMRTYDKNGEITELVCSSKAIKEGDVIAN
ncbi:MAG TPA: phage head closure protein [Clostridia bacterium]